MTPYEERVLSEIAEWRDKQDNYLTRTTSMITAPIGRVYEQVVPNAVNSTVTKAVMGFMEIIHDGAQWTFPNSGIVKNARNLGLNVNDCRELKDQNIEVLDQLARRYFMSNKLIAGIEGAACGLGGFVFIAADIPALFGLSFRCVQQIGTSYGFDMEDPDMLPVVLSVFSVGAAASSATKAVALADMRIAATALAKGWTYKKVAERTQTGVLVKLLKDQTKHLPREISKNITKRKIAQAIPIVGAAVGGGFNYWFVGSTARSAYMIFRDMHIHRKYTMDLEGAS